MLKALVNIHVLFLFTCAAIFIHTSIGISWSIRRMIISVSLVLQLLYQSPVHEHQHFLCQLLRVMYFNYQSGGEEAGKSSDTITSNSSLMSWDFMLINRSNVDAISMYCFQKANVGLLINMFFFQNIAYQNHSLAHLNAQ